MQLTHIHSCRFHFPVGVWTFSDLLKVQNVTISRWHFPCFIFLWTLTGVPAVSYISRLPSVDCHTTLAPSSPENHLQLRPPKVPLTQKCCSLIHKTSGEYEVGRNVFILEDSLRKPLSPFLQVAPHLEAPDAGQRESRRADRWMHSG